MAGSWSDAHDGVTSGRSSGTEAASTGPSAWRCSSRRRATTAGSAKSQTPPEVRSWRDLPGALSASRARTAAAVRPDAWGEVSVPLDAAAALFLARVRGQSALASSLMRATSRGSRTAG